MTDNRDHAIQQDGAVLHDTFAVSLRLSAAPGDVFRAFADAEVRRRWFRLPGSGATYEHDFRVGGGETASSTFATFAMEPQQLAYWSRYLDIVPDTRIVYVYESHVDGVLRWTSLVTVELRADADAGADETVLTWTEQVAFVAPAGDGSDDLLHVRGGTRLRLNGLAVALAQRPRTAVPDSSHPELK
ncbi:SRPBCC domain-containing protein [Streptomyces sp. NPDC049585]|uniref:SRPBCC domain-containing protein n=1 Tax=Streptomyces sp. NPDC049585 TaxID=3155154 RepID=UPI00342C10F7